MLIIRLLCVINLIRISQNTFQFLKTTDIFQSDLQQGKNQDKGKNSTRNINQVKLKIDQEKIFQIGQNNNLFALRQELHLPFNASVPSMVINDGQQIYVVAKNKALIYTCTKPFKNCNKNPQILTPDSLNEITDIQVSPMDKKYLVTAETNGNLNIFVQVNNQTYIKKRSIRDSDRNISAVRMLNNGQVLLAGGYDMILRMYKLNQSSIFIYQLYDSIKMPGIITDIAINAITLVNNFIFVAHESSVFVYSASFSGNPSLQLYDQLNWKHGQVTSVDSVAHSTNNQQSYTAVGGKGDKVCIYKFNQKKKKHQLIDTINLSSWVFSVALSPGGKYLSVGKNDRQSNIYQQIINQSTGLIKYKNIQNFSIGGDGNYVRKLQFGIQGQMLAQARDDSIIRIYTNGGCQDGYHLIDGICMPNTFLWYILYGVCGLIALVGIIALVIIINKKIKRRQAQVIEPQQNLLQNP